MAGVNVGLNISTLNWAYTVGSIAFDVAAGNYAGAAENIAQELICTKFGRALCAAGKRALGFLCKSIHCSEIFPKLLLNKEASSYALIKNLNAVGIPTPSGSQAHHIVGSVTEIGINTRKRISQKFGIDVNSPANGVFLPGCDKSKAIGMVHCEKHTKAYEQAIAQRLDALTTREEVLSELIEIRRELLSGAFVPLNMRSM